MNAEVSERRATLWRWGVFLADSDDEISEISFGGISHAGRPSTQPLVVYEWFPYVFLKANDKAWLIQSVYMIPVRGSLPPPPPSPPMVWSQNLRFAAFRMKTWCLQCFLHGGWLARSANLQIRRNSCNQPSENVLFAFICNVSASTSWSGAVAPASTSNNPIRQTF